MKLNSEFWQAYANQTSKALKLLRPLIMSRSPIQNSSLHLQQQRLLAIQFSASKRTSESLRLNIVISKEAFLMGSIQLFFITKGILKPYIAVHLFIWFLKNISPIRRCPALCWRETGEHRTIRRLQTDLLTYEQRGSQHALDFNSQRPQWRVTCGL